MRIVIDMQGAQTPSSKNRGVGRYTIEIAYEFCIQAQKKRHDVFLVCNANYIYEYKSIRNHFSKIMPSNHILAWEQIKESVAGISKDSTAKFIAEQIREWFISQIRPDILWSTNLQEGWKDEAITSVKQLTDDFLWCSTVHDVIPLLMPKTHLNSIISPWYHEKIEHAKKSDLIITDSYFCKEKISSLLSYPENNIIVAHCAANQDIFYPKKEKEKEKEKERNRFNAHRIKI